MNIKRSIDMQKDAVFHTIEEAISDSKFSTYYNYLKPEVLRLLIDYGYNVACLDDREKCWEISWDYQNSDITS